MDSSVLSVVRRLIDRFIEETRSKPKYIVMHPINARKLLDELGMPGELTSIYDIEVKQDLWIGKCCVYIQ
jgi:hypothetical protein